MDLLAYCRHVFICCLLHFANNLPDNTLSVCCAVLYCMYPAVYIKQVREFVPLRTQEVTMFVCLTVNF